MSGIQRKGFAKVLTCVRVSAGGGRVICKGFGLAEVY